MTVDQQDTPFTDNVKWYDPDGFDHMTRITADNFRDLEQRISDFRALLLDWDATPVRNGRGTQPAPQPAASAGPARQGKDGKYPVDAYGSEYDVAYTPNGNVMAKIKCEAPELAGVDPYDGNWMNYGVTCWPEVMATIGIDLEEQDAGTYHLPPEVERIKVLYNPHGGRSNEGAPDKVVGFGARDQS